MTQDQRDEIVAIANDAAIELNCLLDALAAVDQKDLVTFGREIPEQLHGLSRKIERQRNPVAHRGAR